MKYFFLIAIFLGATAFMLDAFFAHGLRSFLGENYNEATKATLATAARYQLFSSLFLLVLLILYRNMPHVCIVISQCLACLGVLFFCSTIYAKYLLGILSIAKIAPIGGIAFILSFIVLLPLAFQL